MSTKPEFIIPKSPTLIRNALPRRIFSPLPTLAWTFILGLLFLPGIVRPDQVSTWEWEGVNRVVAIGDIHGSYDKLLQLLRGTGLVDEGLSWTGGQDHLVMCGDLVHRGPSDKAVLDLIIRLQGEAEAKGGRVHVILGNHEVLTLVRDLRYVHERSYADYLSEESEQDREKAWEWFKAAHSARTSCWPLLRKHIPGDSSAVSGLSLLKVIMENGSWPGRPSSRSTGSCSSTAA